jgi:hypothetical protein
MTADASFYDRLVPFTRFAGALDRTHYRPLPDGWWVAVADVVDSTGAIAAGRYKAVNFAGAAVIAAVLNALSGRDFPFVFGGDGAGLAVSGDDRPAVETALAATRRWVAEELDLSLRAALVPAEDIRAAGGALEVARYSPSPGISYAMFAGGGLAWAERQMKQGRYGVPDAPPGAQPDLTGLSCRYAPIRAQHGEVLSLIVVPNPGRDEAFAQLARQVLALLSREEHEGRPVPAAGPPFALNARALDYEARTLRAVSRPVAVARTWARASLAWVIATTGAKVKGFDPAHYRRQTAINTDFRKFDDGLKLTVDCDAATAQALEAALEDARKRGVCAYGLHRQAEALMTCLVPSPFRDDHMHFVDGAAGGYAQAAAALKRQVAEA